MAPQPVNPIPEFDYPGQMNEWARRKLAKNQRAEVVFQGRPAQVYISGSDRLCIEYKDTK